MLQIRHKIDNKWPLRALLVLAVIQIAIPLGGMLRWYDVLNTGMEVKFHVLPLDPYDAFRGRYVTFDLDLSSESSAYASAEGYGYGVLSIDENGYGELEYITNQKPHDCIYIKSGSKGRFRMPIDRYYMEENMAPQAEQLVRNQNEDLDIYITVRVKQGSAVVSGLYVNDIPIEEYLKGL